MLRLLQEELPKLWTDETYSGEFKVSPSRHKDFQHAHLHVMKTLGTIAGMIDEQDHAGAPPWPAGMEKYVADLVICAVRLALTMPGGPVDLEKAVLDRIEKKMGVRLEAARR